METPTSAQEFLEVARRLAGQAASEILSLHDDDSVQSRKADHSPVTQADLRADEIIRGGLSKAFPEHAILTEENGLSGNSKSEWVWMIDPLDGTKAYAKKIPGFCVMVGLVHQGRPALGVVVDPLEGLTYEAVQGEGAFVTKGAERRRLSVSDRKEFSAMPLVISTGFPEGAMQKIHSVLQSPLLPPINSVGVKVGLLVRQVGDIYLNHHSVHYWDTCAPQIILEEAGGIFTKLNGAPLEYPLQAPFAHDSRTIASNGRRHEDLVQLLSGVFV